MTNKEIQNDTKEKKFGMTKRKEIEMTKTKKFIGILCLLAFLWSPLGSAEEPVRLNVIQVAEDGAPVNTKIFGNNLLGDEAHADHGAGVWDPQWNIPNAAMLQLARNAGMKAVRFPGGCGTHAYDWKSSIGKPREHFRFGLDEFLRVARELGAEPVYTLSYFTGGEQDAADLVEYLNAPDDGSHPWAAQRAKNGHPLPYGVKYFEVGHEVYHGNHREIQKILPLDYAKAYLKYYWAMKAIDPAVRVGVVLGAPDWNQAVIPVIGDQVDFGILHVYSPPMGAAPVHPVEIRQFFDKSLARTELQYQSLFDEVKDLFAKTSPRKVPLAVTAFNGADTQEEPGPYRHSLGLALVNAELLQLFLKPESPILMANYWNFVNGSWGMIANGFDGAPGDLYKPYFKRPNYYVYEMFANHFGSKLLRANIQSEGYLLGGYRSVGKAVIKISYLTVSASRNDERTKVFLMVVNKNLDHPQIATIKLDDFEPAAQANAWILSGPAAYSTNENGHGTVKVRHREFKIGKLPNPKTELVDPKLLVAEILAPNSFKFTFEPHSMTAIELTRKTVRRR